MSTDGHQHTHVRTCPLCEATCGLAITVVDGAVTRIRGDREDVFSQGFICPKGSTLKQLHEDPDRLRRPLVKRGGAHVEVSWDEAFEAVAAGLDEVWAAGDRDAVAIYLGNPTVHTVAGGLYAGPLIKALGTKNIYSASTVDQMPKHVSSGYLFGNANTIPVPDLDRTDYLLMLGANPHESNGSLCTAPDFPGRMAAIIERGGRIVTVDPRRTKTAAASSEHLAIRPGTDALWLAALVTEIHAAGLTATTGREAEGAMAHVDGLGATLAALAPFTADAVARHTRIDAKTTRRIARELASAPSAAVYGRIGTHTTEFGTLASWLAEVLNIVTGNLDRPGGVMFPNAAVSAPTAGRTPGGRGFSVGRWRSRVHGHPEVKGEFPVSTLVDEITTPGPGQVRALITCSGNPARSCPDGTSLDAALDQLDFMVSIDLYLNETTRHADVILPAPSPLAKAHFDFAFAGLAVRNVVNYSPPIHPVDHPDEPGMEEHDIFARLALIAAGLGPQADPSAITDLLLTGLAQRAGIDADTAIADRRHLPPIEAIIDLMVSHGPYDGLDIERLRASPHGIDLGPLEPRLPELLRTPTGRIDVAVPALLGDLDRLQAVLEAPPDDALLLVGRRHLRSNNSWMHNIEVLVKGRPRCTLQVHPLDADAHGLVGGGRATVRSDTGAVEATVEVTDEVAVGTVSLPHGWGHGVPGTIGTVAARTEGANSNELTSAHAIDPLSGNARLNAIPVTIAAAR